MWLEDLLASVREFLAPEDHLAVDGHGDVVLVDLKARRYLEYLLCGGSALVAVGCTAAVAKSFMDDDGAAAAAERRSGGVKLKRYS